MPASRGVDFMLAGTRSYPAEVVYRRMTPRRSESSRSLRDVEYQIGFGAAGPNSLMNMLGTSCACPYTTCLNATFSPEAIPAFISLG
jgi:hypothetical protein